MTNDISKVNGYPPNSDEAAGTISYLVRAFCRCLFFTISYIQYLYAIYHLLHPPNFQQFTSPSREYKINQEDNEAGIPGILIGDVCSTHSAQNIAYSVQCKIHGSQYITDIHAKSGRYLRYISAIFLGFSAKF